MPNTPVDTDENDFVLKHRITGAAFLLFFGALVLPWLLGPPSDAKKIEVSERVEEKASEEYVAEDLENEVLKQLQADVVKDEQVYISKVTPTGFTKVSDAEREAKFIRAEQEKLAMLARERAEKAQLDKKAQQDETAQRAKTKLDKASKVATSEAKAAAAKEKLANEKAKIDADRLTAEKKSQEKLTSQVEVKITDGWIVQVGVFTDKAGADKIAKDLTAKGFKTSTTTVDTNQGASTGTRVWLGPFEGRDKATKAKASLSEQTGTSGFIRAYP